ncbi:MAG: GDYXXLXY domain-containing protein [Maricaulaceae bacterium]
MSVQTTWRYGLIAVGVMLCALKFISGTLAAEDIRQNGERILIELRPIDPRGLFLGDYMALRYDREALPKSSNNKAPKDKGLAVIRLDGDDIVKFVRLAGEAETLAENERLIRYRRTSARWGGYTYGGARYYFQSGTAERYADAKYGEFRLMPDGRTLLSGLAGEDKVTIHIAGDAPKKATVE